MYMIAAILLALPFFIALWICLKLISSFFEAYVTSVGSEEEAKLITGSLSLAAKAGIFVSVMRGKGAGKEEALATASAVTVSPELASLSQTLDVLRVRKQIVETERAIAKIKQEIDAPQATPAEPQPTLATAVMAVVAEVPPSAVEVEDEGPEETSIAVRDPVTGQLVVT